MTDRGSVRRIRLPQPPSGEDVVGGVHLRVGRLVVVGRSSEREATKGGARIGQRAHRTSRMAASRGAGGR